MSSVNEEVVFCTDLTAIPEEDRRVRAYFPTVFDSSEEVVMQYHGFQHEAEVFMYALANAVQEGRISADEARDMFEPYRDHMPHLYEEIEWEDEENGFPTIDTFMDWGIGPGITDFYDAAEKLDIEGVYYNEGEHWGGGPVFYLFRTEALQELQDALAGRYKIIACNSMSDYDTSASADPNEARRIIEDARSGNYPRLR